MLLCRYGLSRALLALALLFRMFAGAADVPIRDGGINPANLGNGDWIYFLNAATNKLGGSVPSVVNLPTLMSYYKSVGMQYLIVKAGTGSTNFLGGTGSPQFNSNLVYHAHAAGLLIFAYTYSYDDDIQGEINMATRCFNLGADGWIIDGEDGWEAGGTGTNGPSRALQYGEGLRALFPNKFIAHAPYPIISFHSSFPYKEFGLFCDAVMPQDYWTEIYDDSPTAVASMVNVMETEYRNWQNSLTGVWTNAIKPIIPIAQAWSSASGVTTGAEIDEFFDRLRTNANPASVTGYRGVNFWRADLKTADMWNAIRTNSLGDAPGPISLTMPPQSRAARAGTNITFTAWGTGTKPFHYRWRFNGAEIPGATSPNLVLTNLSAAHAGGYSVLVSNLVGVVTSTVATLTITNVPTLLNVAVAAGAREAVVTWGSTNPASTQVEFGVTPALGSRTAEDLSLATEHGALLGGLQADTLYYYAAVSRSTGLTQRSDVLTFRTAGSVIVDNPQAGFTGSWTGGASAADKFGEDYRFVTTSASGNTASAIFSPNISTPGDYDVFIWYPQGGNRTTNAPVSIFYDGGVVAARVNQEAGGGGWRQVATNLSFRTGTNGFARLSNGTSDTNQIVVADAFRFVYRVEQDTPIGPAAPKWWTQLYFGLNGNVALDHDGDGVPSWAEYLAGTVPTNAASALRIWSEPLTGDTFALRFHPLMAGRTYQIEWTDGNSSWAPLLQPLAGSSPATATGHFVITNTSGTVRLYRLKVRWAE